MAMVLSAQSDNNSDATQRALRIPDLVITGSDAVIIVPPLPILPGGGIPVPLIDLKPWPWKLLPIFFSKTLGLDEFPEWLPLTFEELGIPALMPFSN